MDMNNAMTIINTVMEIEVHNKALLQRMIELNEIIELNFITGTPDIDASLEYITTENEYARGEWATSCIMESFSEDYNITM